MTRSSPPDPDLETILDAVREKFGFVPNVLREMAASPAALRVYLASQEAMAAHGVLSPGEQQVVQLAISAANGCHYCTAAHTALGKAAGVEATDLAAIRAGRAPADSRAAALAETVRLLLERQGWLEGPDLARLEGLGVDRRTLYDVVAFVGLKTISNWVNHIAATPVDPELRAGT